MKASIIAMFVGSLFLITACNQDRSARNAGVAAATDEAAGNRPDSFGDDFSANASGNTTPEKAMALNAPERKIVKTADLRCHVKDVFAATTQMERMAAGRGGQISESRMENVTEDTRRLPYKPDSLRQVTSYTTTAHLSLRIPVMALDTVMADIAANAAFINSRNLHLDDVTLRYLSNQLKNDATIANDAAERARALAHHSGEAVLSGDYTDERNEHRIDRRIENMQLSDQVTYATLTVDLYQPQRISQVVIPDVENLLKPTMGQQAGMALNDGRQLLRSFLIGLLHIWPVLLIAALGLFSYRLFRKSRLLLRA